MVLDVRSIDRESFNFLRPPVGCECATKATRRAVRHARVSAIMSTITIDEIERDPRNFVHRMEAGELLLVVNGTRPVAEIKPVPQFATGCRPFGLCAGQFVVPAGFDDPLPPGILEEFDEA